ncbi:MAG: YceD family protein, partial [Actinomycetes bacterium]
MPAPAPHRSGAAASSHARRPAGNPWLVDLRELGRRAGSLHEIDRTIPAPASWRVELIGVPEGAPVRLRLRLESVMEG